MVDLKLETLSLESAHYIYFGLVEQSKIHVIYIDANDYESQRTFIIKSYKNSNPYDFLRKEIDRHFQTSSINGLKSYSDLISSKATKEEKNRFMRFLTGLMINNIPTPEIPRKPLYQMYRTESFRFLRDFESSIDSYLEFYKKFAISFDLEKFYKGILMTIPLDNVKKNVLISYVIEIYNLAISQFPSKWPIENSALHIDWVYENINRKTGFKIVDPDIDLHSKKCHLVTTMDLLSCNKEKKENILNKVRKEWSQKKYRDKNNNLVQYSFNLTKQTKLKLEFLAKLDASPQNLILERLINDAYKNSEH
ncbi:hypothetical protein ACNPKZ_14245 [Shewanella algae]|uniref:hypothetical protein n=1 Tax=Shewanella algae TaxID=38313 RepID=UPI003AAC7438